MKIGVCLILKSFHLNLRISSVIIMKSPFEFLFTTSVISFAALAKSWLCFNRVCSIRFSTSLVHLNLLCFCLRIWSSMTKIYSLSCFFWFSCFLFSIFSFMSSTGSWFWCLISFSSNTTPGNSFNRSLFLPETKVSCRSLLIYFLIWCFFAARSVCFSIAYFLLFFSLSLQVSSKSKAFLRSLISFLCWRET